MSAEMENVFTSPPAKSSSSASSEAHAPKQKTPFGESKVNRRLPNFTSPTDAALSPCTKLLSKPKGKRSASSRMPKKVLLKQIAKPAVEPGEMTTSLKAVEEEQPALTPTHKS